VEFTLGRYVLDVATDFGPRVTGLHLGDGPNLFAVLHPDVVVGGADDPYRFMGGHRVWASPEIPDITYAPDQHECSVTGDGDLVVVTAPPDRAGIVKELSVTVNGQTLEVVNHLLFTKDLGLRLAAWSITQLPQGGRAVMPLAARDTTPLPNRNLVLWPYTSLADPRLSVSDEAVIVAGSGDDPIKLGIGPSPGQLSYWHDGLLFVKTITGTGRGESVDLGASGQVYVGNGFCELESVGEPTSATEGAVASVSETWAVLECRDSEDAVGLTLGGSTS
jgi:hypothetical protein